ncbi:GTP pyrophosphokinase family protein [Citrobacter werkmanii]|uniref:GTP pyrophosphokinase n=1 Tax=Citrobacter werkmanii TaxID=67827 RepID=UPI0015751CD3|nr:hypothetical protein [Citrobacter werkmanii]EKV4109777.1 hypothetical protein [Citrobacter freundii]NTY83934.1 hypothetical protein [Citrobacter werkmanii]HBH6852900.1 hypothetical protein [Citrobacter freundii]
MDEIIKQYDEKKESFDSFALSLKSLLNTLIRDAGYSIHSLESRVKTRNSLSEKIIRKDKYDCIEDITDIIGIRIITHYSDDVDKIAKIIKREFTLDEKNSIDKRSTIEPDRFGYLSLHYVISLSENRTDLTEYASYKNVKAEVQIRSILQHAWAEIEHDIGYKSLNGLPNEIKRYFSRLAGLLEIADDEFIKIKESINVRTQEVLASLESDNSTEVLDLVSLNEYLNRSKTISGIAHQIYLKYQLPVKDTAEKDLDRILSGLFFLDVKTIPQLNTLLKENTENIIKRISIFSPTFFSISKSQGIPRETIIAWLTQILVAKQNSPQSENEYHSAAKLKIHSDKIQDFFSKIRDAISIRNEP